MEVTPVPNRQNDSIGGGSSRQLIIEQSQNEKQQIILKPPVEEQINIDDDELVSQELKLQQFYSSKGYQEGLQQNDFE